MPDSLLSAPLTPIISSITQGNVHYRDKPILTNISLNIHAGEIVSILGKSGSGKTTTLRVLANLTPLTSGHVQLANPTSVAFQQPRLIPWRTVLDNITDPLSPSLSRSLRNHFHHNRLFPLLSRRSIPSSHRQPNHNNIHHRALQLLEEIGLADKSHYYPHQLSGGQAQRVSLARALNIQPQLLLLDEPFSALDDHTTNTMHQLLIQLWHAHPCAIVLITHSLEEALYLSDRILLLNQGTITDEIINPHPRHTSQYSNTYNNHDAHHTYNSHNLHNLHTSHNGINDNIVSTLHTLSQRIQSLLHYHE